MKKILKIFFDWCDTVARARAATELTRMGRWKEAQRLMNK